MESKKITNKVSLKDKRADLDNSVKAAKYVSDTKARLMRGQQLTGLSKKAKAKIITEIAEMEKNPASYIAAEKARQDKTIADLEEYLG